MTSEADRAALLAIARDAIARRIGANRQSATDHPQPPIGSPGIRPSTYSGRPERVDGRDPRSAIHVQPGGAFVTLHRDGALRGCIGHIEATEPQASVVARVAVAAATTDPRFPPVTASELGDLDLEISLLGPLEPIDGPEDIQIGRHGLVVEQGWKRGLLLPQVATEWKWDAETFLAHTCEKAALPRDAWKRGAKIWRFEAEVFGESARER
jgi:uncharacterized protein